MRDKGQPWQSFGDARGVRQAIRALNNYLSSRQRTEQQLETLLNLSPALFCIADDSHLRWLNSAWERQLGWTIAELMANPIDFFIHPDDMAASRAAMCQLAQEAVVHYEARWRHKDGSYHWLSWCASRHDDGQTYVVAEDVGERRWTDETLRQQAEWQAQLLESARHLTASLEIEPVLTRIATEAKSVLRAYGCAIYFLEPDEKTLTPVIALEPPYEDEILSTPLTVDKSFTGKAVKAKRGLIFNDALNDDTGMQIPGTPLQQDERVMALPFIVEEEVLGAMCLSRRGTPFMPEDLALGETFAAYAATVLKNARVHRALQREVEERKRAEQALRESEQRFRTIVETAPSMLHIADAQGRTIYASPNCVRLTGYTQEELQGQVQWWVHGDDAPRVWAQFEDTLRKKRGFRGFEYRAIRKDGEIWYASSSAEPLLDETGELKSVIVQTSDITERVRLEERLREAQKMEAVGRLAGGVAHEFNNLLTIIVGYGEFALHTLDPDHPLREDIEAICRAGRRAAELVQQLLAYSHRQALRTQVVHLNVLLRDMIGTLRHIVGDRVKVVTRLCEGRASVRADVAQIEQIITHLTTNARDAMPDGGTFTLETRYVLVDTEQVDLSPGEFILLIASDTGCGMSPEVQQHLFEPFFTTKEVGRGTGLGLATSYGIITQLGGSVQVESKIGCGTTIRIYLPRAEVSAEDDWGL